LLPKAACGYNAFELVTAKLLPNVAWLLAVTAKLLANRACGYKLFELVTARLLLKVAWLLVVTARLLAYKAVLLPNAAWG
jgi:hypothetical protein